MMQTELILNALQFAAAKHKDQRRKDEATSPYINHLIAVAHLLWHQGQVRDTDILLAGILHDTIEDTDTTAEELEAHFGPSVRKMVEEVTDDKSLPKAERKRLQVETATKKSDGAKMIKLADKSSNVHDVIHFPPTDWSPERKQQYLEWAAEVVAGLRGVNPGLEAYFDGLYA